MSNIIFKLLIRLFLNLLIKHFTNINDSNTFEFRITATDSYGNATLINFSADGTAIALDKASESANTFECSLNVNFAGTLQQNGIPLVDLFYPIGSIYMSTT